MATATHGVFTGVMTFATATQASNWDRYQATRATLKALIADLMAGLSSGSVVEAVYTDKMACLVDLFGQNEALWASQAPTVMWLQAIEAEPIEEIVP